LSQKVKLVPGPIIDQSGKIIGQHEGLPNYTIGQRQGIKVGADQNGDKILEHLQEEHVDTAFITKHQGIPTNYHYVLWFGVDRTILVKHHPYPYIFPKDLPV
jgi:tRNA U34 2-thiouridine synthase MnmA/TrmU